MSESIRILHIDDEPDFADMAATFLERENDRFTIETVTDASEGMERLATGEFDCIVSDYDMPHINGIEFLEAVREDHPELPFILFTGKGSEDVASDALSTGATDYLQKGGDTDRYELLANRIQNSVEQYHNKQRREMLERIRRIVNDVNQALVRASSHQQIETQVCDILADADPYQFAVVAEVDEETKLVQPSTWAGKGEEFLDGFEMSVAEDAPGRQAPEGRAFHEREIAIAQDIQSDPTYEYWRDLALDHGFQSLAVVPLDYDAEFYGLLAVFADRPHAFDDPEQEVLEELGDDVSHALASLDVRDNLRSEKERFRLLAESATDAIVTIDTESTIQFTNSAAEDIFGYHPDELIGEPLTMLMPDQYRDRHREGVTQFLESGERTLDWSTVEFPGLRKDGQEIDLSITFAEFEQDGNQYFEGIIRNITERKTRERELARYETIAETVQDGICVLNRDSEFLIVNDAFVDLTGYARDELLGSHASLARPEELNQTFDELQESLATGSQVESIEMEVETADGSMRTIDARYGQFSHDDETGRVGVWRDITDQKEREQELERQNDRLEEIYGRISDAFFALDEEWQFTHLNDQAHDVINPDGRELKGKNIWEEFPAATERKFKPKYEQAMYDQETVSFEEYYPDPLDAWFEVRAYPSETGLSVYFRDITERKDHERKLEQTEARFQALAENFPNGGVHYFDEDLRYQYVAGAGFEPLDTSPEDLTGNTIYEVEPYSAEMVDTLESLMDTTLAGNEQALEVTYENHIFELRSVPIRDGDGMVIGGFFITQDITDQRRRERDLEHQNDQLEQFASIVSHDLRNPLNVAQGRLELALEECDSEHLDSIADALDRSQTLIDDLLTLSREGKDVTDIEPVNVGILAENCWHSVETTEAAITVATERTIYADRSRLQQLLENLYRNAVEHGSGDVTVTVGDLENGFYVADDGPGIPEDDREQVFEPGYSTGTEGTGYGLQIVRNIGTAHGWDVRATESDEGGARFEITGVEFADG